MRTLFRIEWKEYDRIANVYLLYHQGGVLYPWQSPQVLATTIIGGITLFIALPVWEIFVQRRGKEPYLPLHLFCNIRYMAAATNNGLAAGVYYGEQTLGQLPITCVKGRKLTLLPVALQVLESSSRKSSSTSTMLVARSATTISAPWRV